MTDCGFLSTLWKGLGNQGQCEMGQIRESTLLLG